MLSEKEEKPKLGVSLVLLFLVFRILFDLRKALLKALVTYVILVLKPAEVRRRLCSCN